MRSHTHTRSLTWIHIRFKQAYMYTDTHAHCSYVQIKTQTRFYVHTQTFACISAYSRSYTRTLYTFHTNTHTRIHTHVLTCKFTYQVTCTHM